MVGITTVSSPLKLTFCSAFQTRNSSPLPVKFHNFVVRGKSQFPFLIISPHGFKTKIHFSAKASSASSASVENTEYAEEPATKVKFQKSLSLPGCSGQLVLLGTGYREKVFAIIGVKVYAAGFYASKSIFNRLGAWSGKSTAEIENDPSLFSTIFQDSLEKSLQIVLVRDVDGKTFWDALNDAISPRIKTLTPVDESALSKFRSIFQGRALNKGTFIFLTWLEPSKMLVCISSDALPSSADATIESVNVTMALFDVFLGSSPVSPTLKASVADGLATVLR